jgi:hypothetical protein
MKNCVTTTSFMTDKCNTFYFYIQRTQCGIIQRQIENAKRRVTLYFSVFFIFFACAV